MDNAIIKALVIDDSTDDVDQLRESFSKAGVNDFEFTHVLQLAEGLLILDVQDFDVIILELDLQDSAGITSLDQTTARAPDLPIVVLTRIDDDVMAMSAMQAGAQDCVVKGQIAGAALARSIRYAVERHRVQSEQFRAAQEEPLGRVIALIGAKGGVGTTTVVSNVAAALARENNKVTILELRSDYGTLALQLNLAPDYNLSHLLRVSADALLERNELEARLFSLPYGPRVVFGPQTADEFIEIEPEQANIVIKALQGISDYTIIDLPCNLSAATQLAIRLSDYVGVVLQPESYCVKAGKVRIDQLKAWDVSLDIIGAVVVSIGASYSEVELAEIEARLDCRIVGVIPPAAEACATAMELGVPLVLHQPEQIAAVTLTEMSQRLAAEEIEAMRL